MNTRNKNSFEEKLPTKQKTWKSPEEINHSSLSDLNCWISNLYPTNQCHFLMPISRMTTLPSYFMPRAELNIALRSYWWPLSSSWHQKHLLGRDGDVKYKYRHTHTLLHQQSFLHITAPHSRTTLLHKHYKNISPGREAKKYLQMLKTVFHTKFTPSLPATTTGFSEKWRLQG